VPHVEVNRVGLFYETAGDGFPVIFSHEFGGDSRSWAPQVAFFDRWYRCITYNHRGFPPSAVPQALDAYSQDLLIEDLRGLLRHLGIDQAHLVGLSLGGNVVLNFALRYPELCRGIVVAGTGTGSIHREQFERDVEQNAITLMQGGMAAFTPAYTVGPTRVTYQRKDPRGWQRFIDGFNEHSAVGSALTQRGVMLRRPTIFALEERLRKLNVPALIVVGDEDEPCVEPAVFMKRTIPGAGLLVLPQTGHTVNLEEPEAFNEATRDFFRLVELGRWTTLTADS